MRTPPDLMQRIYEAARTRTVIQVEALEGAVAPRSARRHEWSQTQVAR